MIIINGSRRQGNCYYLANKIKEELAKDRIPCHIITPGNQKIHICTGCMDCDKNGVCDFSDAMLSNIEKIKNDDTILFITPTRWNLLSGDLKIFIDRLNPLYATNTLKDKKLIIIAIGSKKGNLYSSQSAINSLTSFGESAKMNCLLTKEFNECLNYPDILQKENEINDLISELKTLLS